MSQARREVLSDEARLAAADPGGMLARVQGFPAAFAAAWERGCPALPAALRQPVRLISGGMGGSAIAGDLAGAILGCGPAPRPQAVRDYDLPQTSPGDLVLLCSYSGNTEETLSLFEQAEARGLPLIIMTSGGELLRRGGGTYPVLELPGGSPPRAALPSMLGGYLALLRELGLFSPSAGEMEEALTALSQTAAACAFDSPLGANPAKELALALGDDRPVCVALQPAYAVVALRLRCQFEENAKLRSMDRCLPELQHNSWVPWVGGDPLGRPIWLGADGAHERNLLRRRLSDERLAELGLAGLDLAGWGGNPLAHLLSSVLIGDFLSVYHALMRGVDPTPVDDLSTMKELLGAAEERNAERKLD